MSCPASRRLALMCAPFFLLLCRSQANEVPVAGPFAGRHALVIGIDGVRPDALQAAETPHLDALLHTGAVTWNAFAGGVLGSASEQATSSGPGWSSILTGVWRDKHGVSNNDFTGSRYAGYPHFFQRIKESVPEASLSSAVSWNPIDTFIVAPVDAFTDHRFKGVGPNEVARDLSVIEHVEAHLQTEDPDVLFVHLDQVDGAGHGNGYGAQVPAYLEAIENVDDHIGRMLAAIEKRPHHAQEDWLVVVTTDHGGRGTGHGGQTDDERTIFLIASSRKTKARVFEDSPGHTAVPPTVLKHLGIPIDPAWGWESEPFGLPPFGPSSLTAEPGVGDDVLLRWLPASMVESGHLELKRNGFKLADLPGETSRFVDPNPPKNVLRLLYTLELVGAQTPFPALQAEALPMRDPSEDLALHLAFDDGTLRDETAALRTVVAVGEGFDFLAGEVHGEALAFTDPGMLTYLEVDTSDPSWLDTSGDFSLSLWIRLSARNAGNAMIVANKNATLPQQAGWFLEVRQGGDWRWNLGDGIQRKELSAAGPLTAQQWHHLAVVNKRFGMTTLYHNGTMVAEGSIAHIGDVASEWPLRIGRDHDPATGSFMGAVDEIRLWNRRLGPADVTFLYRQGIGLENWLRANFSFEERFDPTVGGLFSDADGDGLTNAEEFAYGREARLPDALVRLRSERRRTDWILTLRQPGGGLGSPGLAYRTHGLLGHLEFATSLEGSWQSATEAPAIDGPVLYHEDGTHSVRLRMPDVLENGGKRFARLRWTLE